MFQNIVLVHSCILIQEFSLMISTFCYSQKLAFSDDESLPDDKKKPEKDSRDSRGGREDRDRHLDRDSHRDQDKNGVSLICCEYGRLVGFFCAYWPLHWAT